MSEMHKNVLITGCSSGIGLSTALRLQKAGFHVFATARKAEDVAKLKQLGFESVQLDVGNSESIHQALEVIRAQTQGRLYAIINNAGYGQAGAVEDLTRDMLRQQFETNVFGLVELTNLVLPWMRLHGEGRIVNISSVVGLVSFPIRGAYNASKYAVEALSDALRVELKDTHIKVSLVEPGPITTKFGENVVKENLMANMDKSPNKERYQRIMINRENPRKGFSIFSFSLPPEAVADKILHALTSEKPRRRYYVTLPTYFFAIIKRLCPAAVIDWLMWKLLQQEAK